MRKFIGILILIVLLACSAQAEQYYLTEQDDLCYHAYYSCGGAIDVQPISPEEAEAGGRYPCPICIPNDNEWESDIAAVARGNTIILRIADHLIESAPLHGNFSFVRREPAILCADVPLCLAKYINGDAYCRFVQDMKSDSAVITVRIPAVCSANDNDPRILNRRHIGNAWYFALQTDAPMDDTFDISWRANAFKFKFSYDSGLTVNDAQQTDLYPASLKPSPQTEPAAFSAQYDDCRIDVYTDAGQDVRANIAVITLSGADANNLDNCTLSIGDPVSIPVNGYMDGENGVFCCTLTDVEIARLKNGEKAEIQTPSRTERLEWEHDKYTAVRDIDLGTTGIANADGTFIIPPIYDDIFISSFSSAPTSIPTPIFCYSDAESCVTVLDGETLDTIAQYAYIHGDIAASYENPSVFTLNDQRGTRIVSLTTLDTLFEIPHDDCKDDSDGIQSIDGWYRCMADGYPDRLAAEYKNGSRLTDLSGNPVSELYPRITPLIWEGDRGVFLIDTWNFHDFDFYHHSFKRGEKMSVPDFQPDWRCGLMDENGKFIAPVEYTSIEVTDDLNIILDGADGPTVIYWK